MKKLNIILVFFVAVACSNVYSQQDDQSARYSSKAIVAGNRLFLVVGESILISTELRDAAEVHVVRILPTDNEPGVLGWDISSGYFVMVVSEVMRGGYVQFPFMKIPISDLMESTDLISPSVDAESAPGALAANAEQHPKIKYGRGYVARLTQFIHKQDPKPPHDLFIELIASNQQDRIFVEAEGGTHVLTKQQEGNWAWTEHWDGVAMGCPFVVLDQEGRSKLISMTGKMISLGHDELKNVHDAAVGGHDDKPSNGSLLVVDKDEHRVHQFLLSPNQVRFITIFPNQGSADVERRKAIAEGLERCVKVVAERHP